jgi:peptidoglycan/xylan/chitin deacetylase (PgdA/CDA1 family)
MPILAAILVLLALVGWAITTLVRPPHWVVREVARRNPAVLFHVETAERAVALTIDDAPHPAVTPGVLDVLRRHGARATFFVIGVHAERYPELVEEIRAGGHELANHLYLDRPSARLDSGEFVRNLRRTDALIRPTGPVKWCRPGSGYINDRIVALMLENGYRPCLASVYPLDLRLPAGWALRHFASNVRPGAILVLHDGGPARRRTVSLLERILPRLAERGYRVLTVSELVALGEGREPDRDRDAAGP